MSRRIVTDSEQIEELNTGLLLYIPYRAMEARIFKALAAAGHDDFTPAKSPILKASFGSTIPPRASGRSSP
jgi:hypothetical protein